VVTDTGADEKKMASPSIKPPLKADYIGVIMLEYTLEDSKLTDKPGRFRAYVVNVTLRTQATSWSAL
jgi:hypothetical protein